MICFVCFFSLKKVARLNAFSSVPVMLCTLLKTSAARPKKHTRDAASILSLKSFSMQIKPRLTHYLEDRRFQQTGKLFPLEFQPLEERRDAVSSRIHPKFLYTFCLLRFYCLEAQIIVEWNFQKSFSCGQHKRLMHSNKSFF